MKPVLSNTDMARAILDGHKTVMRRVVKPQPDERLTAGGNTLELLVAACAPYRPGDILYVREAWTQDGDVYRYKAGFYDQNRKWRPSIHMPREAARIFLRVKSAGMDRLQNITDEQALFEGVPNDGDYPLESPLYCPVCKGVGLVGALHPVSFGYMEVDCPHCDTPTKRFANFWDSTIKPADRALYGWAANPWVWVVAFERCDGLEEPSP